MLSRCTRLSPCLLGGLRHNHSSQPRRRCGKKIHSPQRKSSLVLLHEVRPISMTMDRTVFLLICLFHLLSSKVGIAGRGSSCLLAVSPLPPPVSPVQSTCAHLAGLLINTRRPSGSLFRNHEAGAARRGGSGRLNKRGRVLQRFPKVVSKGRSEERTRKRRRWEMLMLFAEEAPWETAALRGGFMGERGSSADYQPPRN